MDMTLYERNLAFFSEHYPDVYEQLKNLTAGDTQCVTTADGRHQVLLHGAPHGVDASEMQRITNLPERGRQCNDFIKKSCDILSLEDIPLSYQSMVNPLIYHLVVIGIGLAEFLKHVLEQEPYHHLLLFEPTPERLYHSLCLLDWQDTLSVLPSSHRLTLFLGTDSSIGPMTIFKKLREINPLAICPVTILAPPKDSFASALIEKSGLLTTGWMDADEKVRLLRNSFINRQNPKVSRWMPREARQDYPIMIVGSGPSLDTVMEEIRRLAPSCLVVAAGTALGVLLRNNIKPDLVVILGNGEVYYEDYHRCINATPDACSIPLLVTEAAKPELVNLAETVAIYGTQNNPLEAISPSHCPSLAAPTVTNAALGLMVDMGYDDFLFFGVDLGAKNAKHHHAKDTPHMRGEFPSTTAGDCTIKVRGNLGGTVLAPSNFNAARQVFENYIAQRIHIKKGIGIRVCGNGAFIQGTIPSLARKITLPEPLHRARQEVAGFWKNFIPIDPDTIRESWNLEQHLNELEQMRQEFSDIFSQPMENMFDLTDILWAMVKNETMLNLLTRPLVVGLGAYLLYILTCIGSEDRKIHLSALLHLLDQTLQDHCARMEKTFIDLDRGCFDGDWLVW